MQRVMNLGVPALQWRKTQINSLAPRSVHHRPGQITALFLTCFNACPQSRFPCTVGMVSHTHCKKISCSYWQNISIHIGVLYMAIKVAYLKSPAWASPILPLLTVLPGKKHVGIRSCCLSSPFHLYLHTFILTELLHSTSFSVTFKDDGHSIK